MDLFCEALIGYSEEEKKGKEVLRRFPRKAGELGMFPANPAQGDRVVNPLDGMIYIYHDTVWQPMASNESVATNISSGDIHFSSYTMRATDANALGDAPSGTLTIENNPRNDGVVTIHNDSGSVSLDSHTHSTPEPGILNPNLTSASIGPSKPVLSMGGVETSRILTLDEVLNKKESFFIKVFKKVKQWIYLRKH